MLRILLVPALALGLALPAPAPAEHHHGAHPPPPQNNTAAVVGALIALGVLGAILDDDDDDENRDRVEVRRRGDDGHRFDGYHDDGHGWRGDDRVLTAECVRHVRGGRRVLGAECLSRHGHRVDLPGRCLFWVPAGGRDRPVYDMRCLRGAGFYVR